MVDPGTALVVVSFLSPFLVKAGEKIAEKVGEAFSDKVGEIYKAVKERLSGDVYGELTLLRLEEAPEDEARRTALQNVLQEKMAADEGFASLLRKLVEEAKQLDSRSATAKGDRSVAISGDVTSSVISTGDTSMHRD